MHTITTKPMTRRDAVRGLILIAKLVRKKDSAAY